MHHAHHQRCAGSHGNGPYTKKGHPEIAHIARSWEHIQAHNTLLRVQKKYNQNYIKGKSQAKGTLRTLPRFPGTRRIFDDAHDAF
ncbi:hypothetical protein GDO86_008254 [Hymenochirus boettgeri]|uniref:Uncharacterized protein n=1 Tax=Hymenochirus boettgeri TaxID=247094 RepID=A0A8T2IWV0_9PIPI|nr:hypothetical protein GDO86_008254 [Hymenochirus boettgeri]